MFSWLFGSSQECTLVLQPDNSAKILPGFKSGNPLSLKGTSGESVGEIMERFNTYRSPDSQITRLWNSDGSPLPFSTQVNGTRIAIVKVV